MSEIKYGSKVRTHVSVLGELKPVYVGIVVRDPGDGTCDVDIMSLHGGAPWVITEPKSSLRLVEEDK